MKTSAQSSTKKSSVISTIISGDGSWNINIGPLRTDSLQAFFKATANDQLKFDVICVESESIVKLGSKTITLSEAMKDPVTITVSPLK